MRAVSLLIGFVLDLIIGDPYKMPHPIVLIGNGIKYGEKIIRKIMPKSKNGEFIGGLILAIFIVLVSFVVPFFLLYFLYKFNFWLGFIVESFMCYELLATKSLNIESMKVYKKVRNKDLEGARYAVSMIVGRDTQDLSFEAVTKATIETVAENTADGVVAPMFFFAIGGAPLMFAYKAINTLDSMIGYKSEKYLYFGRFAAKMDDVFNFIPARISGIFMVIASNLVWLNGKQSWKIYRRDRHNHASPNSAQTESACAGALEIQLAGDAHYFGKLYKKKTIGDPISEIVGKKIIESIKLMYGTAFVAVAIFGLILYIGRV